MYFNALKCGGGVDDTNVENQFVVLYIINCYRLQSSHWGLIEIVFLTHLAYIVNGKKRVILCNNFTGRISVTLLCGICDVSYPTKQR